MAGLTRRALLAVAAFFPGAALAQTSSGPPTTAPADAFLYIVYPREGARLKGSFFCLFGLRNMGVTRAGDRAPNVGHHHLLIDADSQLRPGDTIPSDRYHVHFGAGQTETRLDLPPGRHTLQLVLGDADHRVFDPPVASDKITITVT
jgi:hypothetical protein